MSKVTETTMYKQYPSYRSSGIEWIGNIPTHWKVKKTTHVFRSVGSGTTPKSDELSYYDGAVPWVLTGDLNDSYLDMTTKTVTDKALNDYSSLKIYPPGTLLIAMYGATIGKMGILSIPATVNQACCALGDPVSIEPEFAFYWFLGNRTNVISLAYGGGQPNISQELVKSLRLLVPPISEQQAIVSFLDRKVEKIDEVIGDKERMIALLQEQRQAVISEAVTNGLNTNVKMVLCGTEYLDVKPTHWNEFQLRKICDISYGLSTELDRGLTEGTKIISLPNVTKDGRLLLDDVPFIQLNDKEIMKYQLKAGDLLFNWRNGSSDHVGKTAYFDEDGVYVHVSFLLKLRFGDGFNSQYFQLFIGHLRALGVFASAKNQVNRTYNQSELGRLVVLVPPYEEQCAIVDSIKGKVKQFDSLIAEVEKQVKQLQEFRQSLIIEAVTGKVDVREVNLH